MFYRPRNLPDRREWSEQRECESPLTENGWADQRRDALAEQEHAVSVGEVLCAGEFNAQDRHEHFLCTLQETGEEHQGH